MLFRTILALFFTVSFNMSGQSDIPPRSDKSHWWDHAVFYEIYPRSFKDSNGDGVGDLKGITQQLNYLRSLGVDAIWITPFYPSPQVDFGYDVSDYVAIDPQFGTLADFDRLVKEAHKRDIKVVTDLVLNHTSDQHAWFKESRSSKTNPKRDWYIWHDPGPNGERPNNWYSGFGPHAWTLDRKTNQYYYHFFYPEQPDLNWRNPAVEKEVFQQIRFWLDRGVDGFRLDAINWLFEDQQLRDNPELPHARREDPNQKEQELKYDRDQPETHGVLQRLRAMTDTYQGDRVLIGEIWVPKMEMLMEYYGPRDNELQLPFNFFFTQVKGLDAMAFRQVVEETERLTNGEPTTYVLSNHDMDRAITRYGNGTNDAQIAKLLATMLLTLRGAPFIYYGEEIGMPTTTPERVEDVRDPVGKRYWPTYKGRDGVRTPMQWTNSANAGFTTGNAKPWLPIPDNYLDVNAAKQSQTRNSILSFYGHVIRLRKKSPALLEGDYQSIDAGDKIFAYRRSTDKQTIVVALNMSGEEQKLSLSEDLVRPGRGLQILVSNLGAGQRVVAARTVPLKPYEAVIMELVER
jgi:alpha-glucosidase